MTYSYSGPHTPTAGVRLGRWLAIAAAIILTVVSLTAVALWRVENIQILSVQTGSMAPVLAPGDAVVIHQAAVEQLAAGDIISFYDPADAAVVVTHRIVELRTVGGSPAIITQGDANPTADQALDPSLLIGRADRLLPKAGYAIDFLRSWSGLATFIYLPAVIICLVELRRLITFFRPAYRLVGHRV